MSLQIVAPPWYLTLAFQTKDGHGFTESYWSNAANRDAAIADATAINGLIDKRRALFTDSHKITYLRVSDSTLKRDTLVKGIALADGEGTYVPAAGDTAPDDDALLQRWQGISGGVPYFALRPLRLIPEEVVTDGEYTPVAGFTTAVTAFNAKLTDATKYSMVCKVGGTPTAMAISGVTELHMSQRKVGRPFGLSAGRSRRP